MDQEKWAVERLSELLGLDVESISAQLMPSLRSLKDPIAARNHLADLLGHGPEFDEFISVYIDRFFSPHHLAGHGTEDRGRKGASQEKAAGRHLKGRLISEGRQHRDPTISSSISPAPSSRSASPQKKQTRYKISQLDPDDGGNSQEHIEALLYLLALPAPQATSKTLQRRRCFCRARIHPLSKFTPICTSCGLVLCVLQRPHYPCPYCSQSVMTLQQRDSMSARLLARKEELQAIRRAEEREARISANAASQVGPNAPTSARTGYAGRTAGISLSEQGSFAENEMHFPSMKGSKGAPKNATTLNTGRVLTLKDGRASIAQPQQARQTSKPNVKTQAPYDDSDDEGMVAIPLAAT